MPNVRCMCAVRMVDFCEAWDTARTGRSMWRTGIVACLMQCMGMGIVVFFRRGC